MKTALYLRVSTEDQAREGYSLEVQRETLEAFVKREGHEIYKVYSDDGISGATTRRPALAALLADAKGGKFGLVLVAKLDRFSRNLKDLLILVDELCGYGVGFKSAGEPFDTTTSAGKLMFQQLGSFAEFERNRIAERVFPGMVKGVQKGNWQGSRYAPYGYAYNKPAKLLELVESEAEVVRQIYAMYLEGKSTLSIGAALTKQGVRNRKGNYFGTKTIGDILKNPIYTGKIVWNTHHYDKAKRTPKGYKYVKNPASEVITAQGRHLPIISAEAFAQAQKLHAEKRITIRQAKPGDYLLSGLLFCGNCNHKFVGASAVSNHRTKATKKWYRCSSITNSYKTCHNKSIKAEVIEPQLELFLELLLRSNEFGNRWPNMTVPPIKLPEDEKEAKKAVHQGLSDNFAKQAKLTDAYIEGLMSKEVFEASNKELMEKGEELKKLAAFYDLRQIDREKSADYLARARKFLSDGNIGEKEPDAADKKRLLGVLVRNVKVGDKKIKNAEFFAPFNFLILKEKNKCRNLKNVPPRPGRAGQHDGSVLSPSAAR
ncbi:MAG: recombinase family protein [Elusimicrobia bacterium]|nr:recombinase family protein [Elusimicrobiota bacterium]